MSPIELKPVDTVTSGELQREFTGKDSFGGVIGYGTLTGENEYIDAVILVEPERGNAPHVYTVELEEDSPEEVEEIMQDFHLSASRLAAAITKSMASDKIVAGRLGKL